jgi:signal transduction histidine kinase
MRPRRGALGLRGRIVGAVLVTTVATLVVAALALLGPLEQSLRHAALRTLQHDLSGAAIAPFRKLDTHVLDKGIRNDPYSAAGAAEAERLASAEQNLGTRIGATVTLLGYFDASGHGTPIVPKEQVPDDDAFTDAQKAYVTGHMVPNFGSVAGRQYARLAIPITGASHRDVLVARKPIDEIPGAVRAVRTAFIYAALAGLALTLILAIPLAATLVRRLRRLRQATLGLAQGAPVSELPVDRARDEVGDLGRAFSIMQLRLQQQEEARRAFVATASHELRTPLTSLEGMLELLDEDLQDASPDLVDARSLLERARAQSRRLGRLAADLLDLSRIDAQVMLRSEPVELGELSRAVIAEFELSTAERSVTPVLDDAGPVWAIGDPGSMARILRILLENALRVSPSGGEITIALRDGDAAVLSVCDQGPGVPPEERELIFERFQRGRDTRGQAGFGLGLAIGRELAERMGGELVLEQVDGSGAKFTLRLPAARTEHAEPLMIS